jgi:curli production assembly/transport component CsgG
VNVGGNAFQFAAVDALLQADIGVSKNSPATLAVREGVQLAVYSLIFEGVKNNLWEFSNPAAGAAFMRELELHQKAVVPRQVAEAPAVIEGPVVVTKN